LFDGVDQRLTIYIRKGNKNVNLIQTTGIQRWHSTERENLFDLISYVPSINEESIFRFSSVIEQSIWEKLKSHSVISIYLSTHVNRNSISYRTAGARYWIIFLNNPFQTESLSNKTSCFLELYDSKILCAALNSNLYWWWYAINYDMFNIKDYMIFSFRFNYIKSDELAALSLELEQDLEKNKQLSITTSKTRGEISTYIYQKKQSKLIIDRIDYILAQHYKFTQEELDYIINYDIKYRMGNEMNNNTEDN
jgi:hypothetical protein